MCRQTVHKWKIISDWKAKLQLPLKSKRSKAFFLSKLFTGKLATRSLKGLSHLKKTVFTLLKLKSEKQTLYWCFNAIIVSPSLPSFSFSLSPSFSSSFSLSGCMIYLDTLANTQKVFSSLSSFLFIKSFSQKTMIKHCLTLKLIFHSWKMSRNVLDLHKTEGWLLHLLFLSSAIQKKICSFLSRHVPKLEYFFPTS